MFFGEFRDFVFLFLNQPINLFAFPIFVHKAIDNKNFNEVENKNKNPSGTNPYIPMIRRSVFEYNVSKKEKQTPYDQKNKMIVQDLFLF